MNITINIWLDNNNKDNINKIKEIKIYPKKPIKVNLPKNIPKYRSPIDPNKYKKRVI